MELRVLTHSGEDLTIAVDTYNADELEMKLNDGAISAVRIGDVVFSRIDIKLIKPISTTIESTDTSNTESTII